VKTLLKTQVQSLSQQAVQQYEEEINYLAKIPEMQNKATELLKKEEAHLVTLKHTLARHKFSICPCIVTNTNSSYIIETMSEIN